jgi:hypothetical protein
MTLLRLRESSDVQQDEIRELTKQFYVTLAASAVRVDPKNDSPAAQRVRELLSAPAAERNWTSAYEVEQLLVSLHDDETVTRELNLRVLEARGVLRKEQADHYEREVTVLQQGDETKRPEVRRIVLARLINDLQWRYTVDETRRRYSKVVTSRAATLFVGALVLLASAIAVRVLAGVRFTSDDLRLFLFAGLAGAWGAGFSMLSTMRSRLEASSLDDLKLIRPWVMLASRTMIGAGGACILYFFVLSGVLGGTAFPMLTTSPGTPASVAPTAGASGMAMGAEGLLTNAQFALLIVWCFIAGFSEQLVPGLLARTEAKADTRASTDDRYRPPLIVTDAGGSTDQDRPGAPRAKRQDGDATARRNGGVATPPGPKAKSE